LPIQPFRSEILQLADGSGMYWEASGNPKGKPALYLHGGPGSGLQTGYRQHFDPERCLIVSFDQRGCGRSLPLVIDSDCDLGSNTTQALLAEIEQLREHLGIERWLLTGMSWGTTLANHLSRRPLTSHFSHQCAAAAAPALVFLQSQIVADPTKRITPSARKHSLYAITYEFV